MIDLEKERKLFQDFLTENYDFENHEQTYFDKKTQCYVNDAGEDTKSLNVAWEVHKKFAESKQAEIDSLKAQQKLNKPARVGGTVFREGVAWKTVIECAQRHYDYGQRDTQPTPLISPSDAIKLVSGELVVVPKEFDPVLAEKIAFECLPRPTQENDKTWIEIAEKAYQDNLKSKKFEIMRTYKELIEAAQENSHE